MDNENKMSDQYEDAQILTLFRVSRSVKLEAAYYKKCIGLSQRIIHKSTGREAPHPRGNSEDLCSR